MRAWRTKWETIAGAWRFSMPMKRSSLFITAISLAIGIALHAQDAPKPAGPAATQPSQSELEAKFISTLTEATLAGRWSGIKNGALTPERDEKYSIVSVTKLDGDNWLINARMKYGDREIVAPIPAQVKWAGDTPVICVTDLTIPGGGTYTARVLIYEQTYAGTWSGKDRGGLLSGIITHTQK